MSKTPQPWQVRLIEERDQLRLRFEKLDDFMLTDTFLALPKADIDLIHDQHEAMSDYLDAVEARITHFYPSLFA